MELHSPVAITGVHIAGLVGEVIDRGDFLQIRDPLNPYYFHGNYLMLPAPPEAHALGGWIDRARALFADDPRIRHVCLVWDTGELDRAARAEALGRGATLDHGVEMVLDAPAPRPHELEIRPLDPEADWAAVVALNRAGDGSEIGGSEHYQAFKARIRDGWRRMVRAGAATWYGAFRDGVHLGQCGMVRAGALGRFQSVETATAHRGQGVCSALVTEVARRTLADGARQVVLEADPTGPALRLYRRLGFREVGRRQSLVIGGGALRIRPENPSDAADVRALLRAAFPEPAEAALVEALRGGDGVFGLVGEKDGAVLGHVLFSPVRVEGPAGSWAAVGLGPMAVRPEHQRQGVGAALIEAGLEACRQRGHAVCVVLGHPGYYPRFGFVPAPPLGVTCKWPVPDEVFMLAELVEGGLAGRTGRAHYHPAFDAV